ncbi:MAG: hypothetical protein PHY15_08325 [Eubacteriales bacterium]|nr:hypothetical protein [Eubacteriales bacterium]MDD4475365.1 hypothetical protein [Eubacteriales bacterium]
MITIPLATVFTTDVFYQTLIIFVIGIMAAVIYTVYHKTVLGRFVRTMIDAGAVGEENAKPLDELGFQYNQIIKSALRNNSTLNRRISKNENGYYIGSMYEEEMKKRYYTKTIGTKDMVLTIVVLLVIFISLWILVPSIVEFLNNLSLNI